MKKKQLEPLYDCVMNKIYDYKNKSEAVRTDALLEMLEDSLWLAPECDVYLTHIFNNMKFCYLYAVLMVAYKDSYRRINGGCDILIKEIDYKHCTIESIKINDQIL